jgi:hypothetical protein
MDLKFGKALVGAIAAVTVSTFTVPFCSSASASTGTMITRHDGGSAIQLAQVEQQESVEKKSEVKTKEVQTGTEAAPGTVTVAPGSVVVAPAAPAPEVSGEVEQKHEERKTTETEHSENGVTGTEERREHEMSSDAKAVPGMVEKEHEEHETKEKVEQN